MVYPRFETIHLICIPAPPSDLSAEGAVLHALEEQERLVTRHRKGEGSAPPHRVLNCFRLEKPAPSGAGHGRNRRMNDSPFRCDGVELNAAGVAHAKDAETITAHRFICDH